ncbi:MAG: hypothetical protein HC880_09875 [Bacteroidia bacterium]|nr:hypothetical protein [Bacteroidia bacterium]
MQITFHQVTPAPLAAALDSSLEYDAHSEIWRNEVYFEPHKNTRYMRLPGEANLPLYILYMVCVMTMRGMFAWII